MKLMCKCGNIEDIRTEKSNQDFEFKNCGDGTIILVCKKCSEVVYLNLKKGR